MPQGKDKKNTKLFKYIVPKPRIRQRESVGLMIRK